jgi:tetratricopeptide (TPR) repeat protein
VRAQTRHQLKQDAFSRATIGVAEKTADWTVEHRNTVMIASLVAIVVIGAAVGGWYYLNTQDQKASLDLSIAVRTMETQLRAPGTPEQPDFPTFTSAKDHSEAARKQLQAIVDKYPHTRSADMAHYFLAVTEKNLGDNASAERDFKEVISKGNKELSSVAKDALAALYADTNRTKDAIALYQDLMNKPTTSVSKVTAQLQLAELYQDSKQPLEAKKMYEQVKKDNPANEAGQLATQRLAQLK